jgi:hypothetical protein
MVKIAEKSATGKRQNASVCLSDKKRYGVVEDYCSETADQGFISGGPSGLD